ncbi:hypothetical protein H4Q26_004559 [Puccinia striiformis f. sp. tritici PST-130]|nr:hypothetical protein H4Q26_004559 [Puccinia striiformis f. sp. tritici PST-130]
MSDYQSGYSTFHLPTSIYLVLIVCLVGRTLLIIIANFSSPRDSIAISNTFTDSSTMNMIHLAGLREAGLQPN